MTIQRAFTIVVATAFACAAVGAGIGWLLGEFAPGYYHAVFARGDGVAFNAKQVGATLGLTQGLVVGAIVGGLVTVAQAIWSVRRNTPDDRN